MIPYVILSRLLQLVPVLIGISIITFMVVTLSPGDPAEISLRATLGTESPPKEAVERLRDEMGLNEPLHIQYLAWVSRVIRGDLGYSIQTKKTTLDEIQKALPVTFFLAVFAISITALIAIPLGIAAGVRPNSYIDHFSRSISIISLSTPEFFIAILLILIGAVHLNLFPVAGSGGIQYYILPSCTLAIGLTAITMRIMRTSMVEVLEQDYIRTARAKGVPHRQIIRQHALKNASLPVITYMGTQFGYLFGGAVIVESIFALPGIGRLLVDSVQSMDIMVIQGCMLTFALIFVLINLVVDIAYMYLDPTIRYQEG